MVKILVLGAGELGTATLEALARHPSKGDATIAVLLRQPTLESKDPAKKSMVDSLQALGIEFEAADVVAASATDLAAIFSKYDVVISCNGMSLPSGTQIKLSEAALEAKVARYFPWQFGMDYDVIGQGSSQDLFDEQLRVRAMLRGQQTTDWTIISTGLFTSFLFLAAFGVVDIDQRIVRALGSWDNRLSLTTPEDIGRVTADVVLEPRGVSHQVVFTAGDTVSYGEVADLVDEHFGGPAFKRELWDMATLKKQMEEEPDSVMVKYRETFAHNKGVWWDMDKTVNVRRGLAMTDVRTYLSKTFAR
jgi:hypothetical protein